MAQIHNLDESVQEYFEFIVKGHNYRFRHMNTEEMEAWKDVESDDVKAKEYLYSFISKVNADSPEFSEVAKTMITPHWLAFKKMVQVEFGG
jgi:hypothetical protein